MKVVLVSQRIEQATGYDEIRECLDVRWASYLRACGFLQVGLPVSSDPREYLARFSPAGIVLTGGNDLSTFLPQSHLSVMRDAFENRLITSAVAAGVPVLGVCRGMQVVTYLYGGRIAEVPGHVRTSHALRETARSILGAHVPRRPVNSYHRFAVTEAPRGFTLLAASGEGEVEMMEDPSRRIVCLMWHPERNDPFRTEDLETTRTLFSERSSPIAPLRKKGSGPSEL